MKKAILIIIGALFPLFSFAQNTFDAFENEREVTSVVVTKNMFKLLSKMDLDSKDPEAQAYLNMVNSLDNIKIFTTENPEMQKKMDAAVKNYLSSGANLEELMKINDRGQEIKFFVKEGKNKNSVQELLMHLTGNVDGKHSTVIMTITGDIDLIQLSQLTSDLKVPGSEQLKNIDKKTE